MFTISFFIVSCSNWVVVSQLTTQIRLKHYYLRQYIYQSFQFHTVTVKATSQTQSHQLIAELAKLQHLVHLCKGLSTKCNVQQFCIKGTWAVFSEQSFINHPIDLNLKFQLISQTNLIGHVLMYTHSNFSHFSCLYPISYSLHVCTLCHVLTLIMV